MGQVRFNQESTERQYNLASKAQSLGWSPEQIRILDRDLGQSGAPTTNREDFKTLVSDVAMGQVGAIFSLEASRLARSNQDWHRLLELCAITGTLVIDEDGCYDPAEFNDGLVLGMKGTFAQAELHIIRARLHGGKLNKAHKGELHFALPVGFVFDDDKIVLDPDQEVQGAVRTVFELFEQEGTRLCRGPALPGARTSLSTSLVWRRMGWQTALGSTDPFARARYPGESILRRHLRVRAIPSLASRLGRPARSARDPASCHRRSGASSFPGTIQAISPGISSSPTANAWRPTGPMAKCLAGPAREGLCLLQGLLLCGICGRRLGVRYTGNGGLYPIYQCNWKHREALSRQACMSVASKPLDDAIAERLVGAVTPVTIELALEALTSLEERDTSNRLHSGGCGSSGPATTPIWRNGATRRSTPPTG